jgi:hypothetical protein
MATDDHDHEHDHEDEALARIEAISKEGAHRAEDHEGPFSIHLLGIGKAGAGIVAAALKAGTDTAINALAIDIGDQDLGPVQATAGRGDSERVFVETLGMAVPDREALSGGLNRYREYLKMEYPRYYWNPNYEPWLPGDMKLPAEGEHVPRAIAKAIYNCDYYQGGAVADALQGFADRVLASEQTPIVVVAFGLGGGTGGGIVVDLARHLSSIKLGRRPWVVGVGVLPCSGDPQDTDGGGALFPMLSELDCMIDTEKNKGVMAVWGDLYKNAFTGGFFVAPQQDIFERTKDLDDTHAEVDAGIANFLVRDHGVHVYETLKAINWLGIPASSWHPAIRGEPSDRWINVLAPRAIKDLDGLGRAGLTKGVETEYAEARVFSAKPPSAELKASLVKQLGEVAHTTVKPGVLHFENDGADDVNVVIPRVTKLDLEAFIPSRDAYDKLEWEDKLFIHSWLLDLGVMLCEPSIRFEGMGGECIWGCACWVVVPHAAIRGE